MNKTICLVGNPNCGKTTLFNLLTGSSQKVGNWAGVTVDKVDGSLKYSKDVKVVDLPGLYSLTPTSLDERVVIEHLKNLTNSIIINVLDGTNLERNLYLTLNLLKLGMPVIVAVNMIDELKKEKITINTKKLSEFLGVPVLGISAKKHIGIKELVDLALSTDINGSKSTFANLTEEKIYPFLEKHINLFIANANCKLKQRTEKIDKVLSNGFFGGIIFIAVMSLVYFLSLKFGGLAGDKLVELIVKFSNYTAEIMRRCGCNEVAVDLLINGVFKGVGTVVSFLPHIIIMFFLMTFLEESGYTARVALLFDKLFSSLSLSGKSAIPFVLSCGCTVAGIEASRTIEGSKERELTIMLTPFLPCGAKSAVFGWFAHVFFDGSVIVALSLYFLSILVVIIIAKIYTLVNNTKEVAPFVLELPIIRFPTITNVLSVIILKVKEFLIKSGTTIFAVSVGVWLLSNFGFRGYVCGDISNSFLYYLGNGLKYLFYPLGFGNWQASVSIITGSLAKEAVVETLQILHEYPQVLFDNAFSVYAFMAFTLLSPPCLASVSVAYRELKSKRKVAFMLLLEIYVAYVVALIINTIGKVLSLDIGLILSLFIVIIVSTIFILSLRNVIKRKCCGACVSCKRVSCETTKNDV